MFRKLMLPVLLILAFVVLTACVQATPAVPTEAPAPVTSTSLPAIEPSPTSQAYNDALGRAVTILAKPVRIVSLAPSVTEILFAIGAGPQVVGRTKFCNYPPEVTSLPEIGGFSAKSISVEAIL